MKNKKYFIESKLAIYLIGKIITAVITLLSIPLYINWFGEVRYGEYILAYTTFLVFLSGSLGWLNHALIKHYTLFKDNYLFKEKIQTIVLWTSLISATFLCVLLNFSEQVKFSTVPIIFLGFIFGCFYLNELIFTQVNYKAFKFVISEFLRLSVCLLLVYLLNQSTSFSSEKVLFLGVLLSYFIGYFYQTKLKLPNLSIMSNKYFDRNIFRQFLSYGLPIGIWMALTPSSNTIDRYIISSYMGAAALTQYTAVYDVVFKVFTQLATPVATIIQPLLMQNYNNKNTHGYMRIRNKAALYLLILFLPSISMFILIDDFIITKYLGFKDLSVINKLKKIVIPIALSSLIWQIAILLQRKIEASGRSYLVTIAMLLAVSLSALLTIIFLPKYDYGILGYISLITSLVYLIIIYFLIRKK